MKCRMILAFMLAAVMQQALADDYNTLTVKTNTTEEDITLSIVQKITFSTTEATVHTTDGNYTYALSELDKMTFASKATAIKQLPEQAEGLVYESGKLKVSKSGTLRIYNANGTLIRIANVTGQGGQVDLTSLPKGLYIVSQGKQNIKILK